jgi:uncharacterized protein (TIGR04255 family)
MAFKPINDDHAIQFVRFTLTFDRPLSPSEVRVIQTNHRLWRDDLPAISVPQGVALQMNQHTGMVQPAPVVGVEFSLQRPDGSPAWALRFVGNEIVVECTRYSRWDRVWTNASTHFAKALTVAGASAASATVIELAAISLEVVDAFVSDETDMDLSSVIRTGPYISEHVFSCGPVWHLHHGWFTEPESDPVLERLNLTATREEPSNGGGAPAETIKLLIEHAQQKRLRNRIGLSENISATAQTIHAAMEIMHRKNKTLLSSLLVPGVAQQIGLAEEASS